MDSRSASTRFGVEIETYGDSLKGAAATGPATDGQYLYFDRDVALPGQTGDQR